MYSVDYYREAFLKHLNTAITLKEPRNLYEPIQYILQLGGKRLRPVLALIAADLFDSNYQKAMEYQYRNTLWRCYAYYCIPTL